MSRCLVSMSGPGTSPWIRNAPSRIAMPGLPGPPNPTAGTRAPPPERHGRHQRSAFTGIGGAFGRDHAAHVALAEGLGRPGLGLQRVTVGNPIDDRGSDARNG